MKLTDQDKERLREAISVATGGTLTKHANYTLLGWDWYAPSADEVRAKCRDIIFELIVKAGEPEPVTTSHTDVI